MKNPTLDSYPKGYDEATANPVERIPWNLRQYFRFARHCNKSLKEAVNWAVRNYGGTLANGKRLFLQAKADEAAVEKGAAT
jgi:hypothetical protein